MLWAGLAALGLVLLAGGAWYARKEYYAAKPQPVWVPLALPADISMEDQRKLAEDIEGRLRNDDLLMEVVIDADLQAKFGSSSEKAALEELKKRLFVKVGTADTPQGLTVPSINVGVTGNGHQKEASGIAATRIAKDVWKTTGLLEQTGMFPLPEENNPPKRRMIPDSAHRFPISTADCGRFTLRPSRPL